MTALVPLAVTAALAVLLAVVFHLGVAAAVVGIVGILATVPNTYLAWTALPATRVPVRGRVAGLWNPVELGVHQVIGGGRMPKYVSRPHDELLRAVLDPAVPNSRLVVVRGGSSTGKTRAAYEAVMDRLADWWLDYPLDPGGLAARLDAGIRARTVLWLGELRQYADADGGPEVLGRLADLLTGEGHVVITTMWPEHWTAYTVAARAGPGAADPAGTAGRLLARLPELTSGGPAGVDPARGGVIDVPARFTVAEMATAARAGDPLVAEAAAAAARAGQEGQVTQYLAGVPDLLDRYAGPGGDPYGQAVITAAMDAARLGHASPLTAALLQDAAVGYLTGPQRTASIESWRDTALAWAAEELHGAVRALQPVPPAAGTGIVGYQVADYLDQYARRTRQDRLGPTSLWDALTTHAATPGDLDRLGDAAHDRGLYRYAAALWTKAATMGSAAAARDLIYLLHKVNPGYVPRAAQWAVGHISFEDPWALGGLMEELREAGADDAVRTLLDRDPTAQVSVDDPSTLAWLLVELREAGADGEVTALATRAVGQVNVEDPRAVAALLAVLRAVGADDAVRTLLDRDPAAQVRLDDPRAVAWLLQQLREAGADGEVTALVARAASQVSLDDEGDVRVLLEELREAGADDAVRTLLDRDPTADVSLDHPDPVAELLKMFREAKDPALATRAVGQVNVEDPRAVAALLAVLRAVGADDAVRTLLDRDPAAQVRLDDPRAVAWLLQQLREAGADGEVTALVARAASQVSLDDEGDVRVLLEELREAGADDVVTALAARAANGGMFDLFLKAHPDEALDYLFGREPDGTRSQCWKWQEPGQPETAAGE